MASNDRSIFEVTDRDAALHRKRDDVLLMGIRRTSSGDVAHIQFHTGDYLQYNRTTDVLTLYEGDVARVQFSVASAGNVLTTGYLRIGSLTAPTNTTAGDLTFVRCFVNNDSNFSLQFSGADPQILLDSTDYLLYSRAGNSFSLFGASDERLRLSFSTTAGNRVNLGFWVKDTGGTSRAFATFSAHNSADASAEDHLVLYTLNAAGANQSRWDLNTLADNVDSTWNSTVRMHFFAGGARVGAVTDPSNVTAGDLTVIRLSIGNNLAFGASANFFDLTGTLTSTSATQQFARILFTISPTSASTSEFRGLDLETVSTDSGGTLTTVRALLIQNRHRTTSTVTTFTGAAITAVTLDSSSAATQGAVTTAQTVLLSGLAGSAGKALTLTTVNVLDFLFFSTAAASFTITTGTFINIPNPLAGATITTLYGIDIAALTRGSTNIGIRNNSTMRQVAALTIGADAAVGSGMILDVQGGDIRLGAAAGDNVQLRLSTAHPATPAANFEWHYPFTTTSREVPWWLDDGGFMFSATEEISVVLPRPVNAPNTNAIAGPYVNSTPTTTSAFVGLVHVPYPIEVAQVTYRGDGTGTANAVVRIAIYSADGQTKFLDTTDAVGAAAAGLRTINVTDFWLGAGIYLFFVCLSSGTTSPAILCWDTEGTFVTVAGEVDIEGALTVAGGAAPATIDTTALTTPQADSTPIFRLDGTLA